MNRISKAVGCVAVAGLLALAVTSNRSLADSTHIQPGPVTSWLYGWMPAPGGPSHFSRVAIPTTACRHGGRTSTLVIAFNNSLNDAPKGTGTFRVPRNRLVLVPGTAGELAVRRTVRKRVVRRAGALRWIGIVRDFQRLHHEADLLALHVDGDGAGACAFLFKVPMHAGESVDFGADYGSNQSITCDAVGLQP